MLSLPNSVFLNLSLTAKPPKSSNSSFFNGSLSISFPTAKSPPFSTAVTPLPSIQAMKKMQGRVVCATSDKTVAVEVVRLAPHPKYKRRVRMKKKYQAHDPDNQFKVGDFVQLEKSRPISKTKTFIAVPVPPRNAPKPIGLGIPLQSQQENA